MGIFSSLEKLKLALKRTKEKLGGGLISIFKGKNALDIELENQLEEALVSADVSYAIVEEIIENLRGKHYSTEEEIAKELKRILLGFFYDNVSGIEITTTPYVILVVGVNGTGKTTSIAKLAKWFKDRGKRVILGAADTFRAASQEQLRIWAERVDVPLVGGKMGGDAASVAFDTVSKANAKGFDVAIIDTAGRIHTRKNLMDELSKIHRVISKVVQSAPHETLLVLDATTGQNALAQAMEFRKATRLTGVFLTKLDSSAKGGMAFAIKRELGLPIKMVGIGEKEDDIIIFNPEEFVEAIINFQTCS